MVESVGALSPPPRVELTRRKAEDFAVGLLGVGFWSCCCFYQRKYTRNHSLKTRIRRSEFGVV